MTPQPDARPGALPGALRARLGALPEPPLPPDLWPRIARARRRQVARRRLAAGGGLAVLLALAVLPLRSPEPLGGQAAPSAPMAAAPGLPYPAAPAMDAGAQLRVLDRELQAAYRTGAGEAHIAQLWAAREALLRGGAHAAPVRPIRI